MKKLIMGALVGTGAAYAWKRLASGSGGRLDDATLAGDSDDARLTEKVKSEIFRDPEVPKGQINVNAEYGKVILRGEVESEDMVQRLVEATRNVQGVSDVESLLSVSS